MGLDIYAYKVKGTTPNTNTSDIYEELKKTAQEKYHKTTAKLLKELSKQYEVCSPIEYANCYSKFIDNLKRRVPLYKKYGWTMKKFGYEYSNNVIEEVKTPQEVSAIIEDEEKHIYAISDAYFRKVNFIYAYFSKCDNFENESCTITKNELNEFIQICKDVYNHKGDEDYATENLPTRSGFFFGSTDYDEWYWEDVKNCIKQMTKLYKSLKDDDYVMWDFSW